MVEPKGSIKNANLTFTTKVLWLLVWHYLSPTAADNLVNWDRAVLMAAMISGFNVYFWCLLQAVMHERDFKDTTTYPLWWMFFSLCRLEGVGVWHVDVLKNPPDIVDIGLIRDETNELANQRRPRPNVYRLWKNIVATLEQSQAANPATYEPKRISRVVAPLWAPLSRLYLLLMSRLLGSTNLRHNWPHFCTTSSLECRGLLLRQRSA